MADSPGSSAPSRQHPPCVAEGDLRDKNQITIPRQIIDALDLSVGDKLVFVADVSHRSVLVFPARVSYAGALKSVYGTPDEAAAYVHNERDAWEE